MDELQSTILEDLQTQSFAKIKVRFWTPRFRAKLVDWLKSQGYDQCQFYRVRGKSKYYIIALPDADIPYPLEEKYKISVINASIPLCFAMILIIGTILWKKHNFELTSIEMVFGVPIIIGMLIEYFSNLISHKKSLTRELVFVARMIFNNFIICFIILALSIFILREGIICIIMLLPFILILPFLGAILMRLICIFLWEADAKVYSLAALPLLLGGVLPETNSDYYGQTQRSVIIHASKEQVFHAIQHIGHVQPDEVKSSFIFLMGIPKPISGATVVQNGQLMRQIKWERGVNFEEIVVNNQFPNLLSWTYQFKPESFPKGSMDDHVVIGGKYFNLLDTSYKLDQIDNNTTKLTLTVDYRVSTEYNWYSKLWANYIINQYSDVVMNIHKQRLEPKT